jgi:hypothetical protein
LVAAVNGSRLYLSSEEAPIRLVSPRLERLWTPLGGEPVVGRLGESLPDPDHTASISDSIYADHKVVVEV